MGRYTRGPVIESLETAADYKRWLLGQSDIDPYLIKAIQGV